MNEKFYLDTYDLYIATFGKEYQYRMCIEEMSELTKALCKLIRYSSHKKNNDTNQKIQEIKENIIEEVADVLICAKQMKYIFGQEQVKEVMDYKIQRGRKAVDKNFDKIQTDINEKFYFETFKNFISVFGEESQYRMCIEEMSELTKELCKFMRYTRNESSEENDKKLEKIKKNIIEETADVLICTSQIMYLVGQDKVTEIMDKKIARGRSFTENYIREDEKED